VSSLYPALLEPVTQLLDDTRTEAANLVAAVVATLERAVKASDASVVVAGKDDKVSVFSSNDRFLMVHADLRRLADKTLAFLHKAVAKDKKRDHKWSRGAKWIRRVLASLSLDLVLPPPDSSLQADLDTLLDKWQARDQDLGALAFLTDDDLPALAALIPAFTDDLRRQWRTRRAELLRTTAEAPPRDDDSVVSATTTCAPG